MKLFDEPTDKRFQQTKSEPYIKPMVFKEAVIQFDNMDSLTVKFIIAKKCSIVIEGAHGCTVAEELTFLLEDIDKAQDAFEGIVNELKNPELYK